MNCQRLTNFAVVSFVLMADPSTLAARQSADLKAAVAQHYPQSLVEEALDVTGKQPPRKQCFSVLENLPSGAPKVVVAGYTNLLSGAVRLLQRTEAGFDVIAEPDFGDVTGWGCEAEALDLTNDGRNEAVVRFITGESSVDWIFEWNGQEFRSLSPTSTDPVGLTTTRLLNTSFADIDGDRILEMFTASALPREGAPYPGEFYRLSGSEYVMDRRIVSMNAFQRADGTPETDTVTVPLPRGAVGPFTLRVFNGAGAVGANKRVEDAVQSGRVWWNGQEIVSPNHFGNHVAMIERTVVMQAENELMVRLAGSPGGRITIVIDAASWTP
jgi:hypothetical protein